MGESTGKTVGGYELVELAGSGGFGEVYRARKPGIDRDVAVKVILPEYVKLPDFLARFRAEARMVAKLEHPHIVPLYDHWLDDQGAFLVMRYLRGGSLRDRLKSDGPLAPHEVGRVLEHVCQALSVAHEQSVVHRDLKPENILFDERSHAYLTDFGIAKDLAATTLTRKGQVMGTAAYMAPEQVSDERVTAQTDIYVLGVLLYEMLTDEHPFPDLDPLEVVHRHATRDLPSILNTRPELSPSLDAVIAMATAKAPVERYASAPSLLEAYRQAVH